MSIENVTDNIIEQIADLASCVALPSKGASISIMPGPKMGPRPADFCEELVKASPTFVKWEALKNGEKLRYVLLFSACRYFTKGHEQDEERLMRRIMIARRNNLRDHAILKQARKIQDVPAEQKAETQIVAKKVKDTARKRRPASTFSDSQVAKEMDVAAVEATRSYRAWSALPIGAEFVYNQKYHKGEQCQDWLLRKNIWRRMRYRRENKKLVVRLRGDDPSVSDEQASPATASEIVDGALPASMKQKTSADSPPDGTAPAVGTSQKPNVDAPVQDGAGAKRRAKSEDLVEHGKPAKAPRTDAAELPPVTCPAVQIAAVQNPVPDAAAEAGTVLKEEIVDLTIPDPSPQQVLDQSGPQALITATSTEEDAAHAALTAAAAATASGSAEDLVEQSAVEAAVAAAADYVQSATQQNDIEDDDDDEDEDEDDDVDDDDIMDHGHHHLTTLAVHNSLEAAANAAALDSAAKLAAAATAQQ